CSLQLSFLLDSCEGSGDIAVVSGYRSREAQDLLYLNSLKEHGEEFTTKYVALPGASEHQTGLAVDVGLFREETDYISPAFPDEGAGGRFRRAASEFGFIRRYQENKTAITGIADEPWHYRYVGYPHSAIIDRENLCLEEYTDYLKQFHYGHKNLYVEGCNRFYEIYFTVAKEEVIPVTVPANRGNWLISGNNEDGFIVTAHYATRVDGHV
ncbi:MAG: D-alanyl-D-alanine carboxypeptidase family protein, partial [Bacillota bacterium]